MRLSVVQLDAALDGAERERGIETGVAEAAAAGSALVLFPELVCEGYGRAADRLAKAASLSDLPDAAGQRLADAHGIAVCLGLSLRLPDGTVGNAAVLFRPGHPPSPYLKRHLYGDYEKAIFAPGQERSALVEWGGLTMGMLVCFDAEFPERVRELALAGADLVLVPTALPKLAGADFIASTIIPARAFENGIFVAYADHCGRDERFEYQGLSVVADPNGTKLASADETSPAHLVADLDPARYAEVRKANPYLETLRRARAEEMR